jgi:hypothetical protein
VDPDKLSAFPHSRTLLDAPRRPRSITELLWHPYMMVALVKQAKLRPQDEPDVLAIVGSFVRGCCLGLLPAGPAAGWACCWLRLLLSCLGLWAAGD